MKRIAIALTASLLLGACATSVPQSIVSHPTSVRPVIETKPRPAVAGNGSIYQMAGARGLFEDHFARHVGDAVTVQIEEVISASSKSGNKAARTGNIDNSISTTASSRLFTGPLGGIGLKTDNSNKFEGSGETSSSNNFTGSITASVIEVLGNGSLVVAGEKQINLRGETSFLRISGIVNPTDIKAGNVVSSTKLAEARIEEVGTGSVAAADKAGWLTNFFYSLSPF